MTEHTGPGDQNDPQSRNRSHGDPAAVAAPSGGRGWLPAAIALIVGLVLGAVGWALARPAATTSASSTPTATVTVTSTPTAALKAPTATVPAACKQLSTDAQKVQDLLGQAADAAKTLDATRLSTVVRKMDTQQKKISAATKACTDAMPSGATP